MVGLRIATSQLATRSHNSHIGRGMHREAGPPRGQQERHGHRGSHKGKASASRWGHHESHRGQAIERAVLLRRGGDAGKGQATWLSSVARPQRRVTRDSNWEVRPHGRQTPGGEATARGMATGRVPCHQVNALPRTRPWRWATRQGQAREGQATAGGPQH